MKIYRIANDSRILADLRLLYEELRQEMLADFARMKEIPTTDNILVDKNVYGRGFMYSGRVGAMEDALDAIQKLLKKYQ